MDLVMVEVQGSRWCKNGQDSTGGGGGGEDPTDDRGGHGGSGIIIIRYQIGLSNQYSKSNWWVLLPRWKNCPCL